MNNIKINQEQLNKAKTNFSKKFLSDVQKSAMLSDIYTSEEIRQIKPIVSPFGSYFLLFRRKDFVGVLMVILIFSGTAYASAHSLPGDLLYAVKTKVLEPIVLSLKFSEKSKNEYSAELLKRRIDELEKLRERGRAEEEVKRKSSEIKIKNTVDLKPSAILDNNGANVDIYDKKLHNFLTGSNLEIEDKIFSDKNDDFEFYENLDILNRDGYENFELNEYIENNDDDLKEPLINLESEVNINHNLDL